MFGALVMVAALGQLEYPAMPGHTPAIRRPAPYDVPAPPPYVEPVKADRVPDTTDAVSWALQDILLRQPHDRPYLRYLWIPPWGGISWHQVNSYLVNTAASQASVIVLPEGAAGGWLIVWDLRRLAPKAEDLKRLLINWDALGTNEFYFHAELQGGKTQPCREYTYIDGKSYKDRRFVPAPHVAEGYALLEQETLSFAPLLRADDFLRRVASTIDGGLYYHFVGFIRDGKRLTEQEIFKLVGLDVGLSREVKGDDRAAVFQSAVTGKPRTVEQVQGALGKARITYDIFDEDVDAKRHAMYELLESVNKSRGKEIIFERENGLFGYILTDGEGKLADVAPPNLVADHQTPAPITKQLFPPLSCIRCHGPDGGIKQVRNDVPALLAGGQHGDVELFDDLSSKEERFATVDRLAGLFAAGDAFEHDADLSRSRYADAVWRSTKGMGVTDKENVAVKSASSLADQYADFFYPRSLTEGNVNADRACLELGYRVREGEGSLFLKQALKPRRTDFTVDGVPVESADPAAAALSRTKAGKDGKVVSAGLTIRRQDFDRIYAYMAFQILESRKVSK